MAKHTTSARQLANRRSTKVQQNSPKAPTQGILAVVADIKKNDWKSLNPAESFSLFFVNSRFGGAVQFYVW
jgi:hypothetical protein